MRNMSVNELAEFVLTSSSLPKDEFEKKLNTLSAVDLQNARELIIVVEITRDTAFNKGYREGAQEFKDWLIGKYPAIKEWADSVNGE